MTAEFEMRYPPFPPEPAFDTGPRLTRPGNGMQVPPSKRVNLRRPVRDPEFERSTENDSRAMAQRFAPARDEPAETSAFGLLRRRRRAASAPDRRAAERGPVWPGSMPAPPTDGSAAPEEHLPHARIEGDELYGRAVAIVRAQRKASAAYLQQSLGIGYMRAADLIDRMEREGIVGAPIHNGLRPILGPSAYARTV
jgi:DNA segregation ATPase FtsK/SpoIIIE-like protein